MCLLLVGLQFMLVGSRNTFIPQGQTLCVNYGWVSKLHTNAFSAVTFRHPAAKENRLYKPPPGMSEIWAAFTFRGYCGI